jgi:hypothetical protein
MRWLSAGLAQMGHASHIEGDQYVVLFKRMDDGQKRVLERGKANGYGYAWFLL